MGGLEIEVERKRVKNVNLRIYPPNGQVRVSVPASMSDDEILRAIDGKLEWILHHRERIRSKPAPPVLAMVTGEQLPFLGREYRLEVRNTAGRAALRLNDSILELRIRPDSSIEERIRVVNRWYRRQMELLIPPLIEEWAPRLGVVVHEWGVRRMKTRWGSCNPNARRIWLSLELAKKPSRCLEYVVVHELAHLIEPGHNKWFYAILDHHMPGWRAIRAELREHHTR